MRDLFPSRVARAEGRYTASFSGDVKKKKKINITLKENASTVQISLVFFLTFYAGTGGINKVLGFLIMLVFQSRHSVELVVRSEC